MATVAYCFQTHCLLALMALWAADQVCVIILDTVCQVKGLCVSTATTVVLQQDGRGMLLDHFRRLLCVFR